MHCISSYLIPRGGMNVFLKLLITYIPKFPSRKEVPTYICEAVTANSMTGSLD